MMVIGINQISTIHLIGITNPSPLFRTNKTTSALLVVFSFKLAPNKLFSGKLVRQRTALFSLFG